MTQLSAELIARVLVTRRLGRSVLAFDRIGSTNDVAHEQARAGADDGLLVVAEEQTAGRGRLARTWWAPSGTCLLMSVLLRPSSTGHVLSAAQAGQLTMSLGLGAVEAIGELTGLRAHLKWPNDLLIGGRKLGGMLTELDTDENRLNYAVLGFGLNVDVDFAAAGAPAELVLTATSLQTEAGHPVDRLTLLAALLEHTERWYDRVLAGESPHEAWAQRLDTLGRRVRVSFIAGSMEGMAVGVTPEGGLLVQDDGGVVRTVWSGDVTALR
jgi:BirA family transcriptional regulator, biotin operon repressor / biotin---[acetyl-CoA-carboxylase] ligase